MVFNIRGELGVCPPLGDKNEAKAKTEVAELQAERGQRQQDGHSGTRMLALLEGSSHPEPCHMLA